MYASQTKRLCVRRAQSDETRVQHHTPQTSSSSEGTTVQVLTNPHQTCTQSRASVVVLGGNMTASASDTPSDTIESSVTSPTSTFPAQDHKPNQDPHECQHGDSSSSNESREDNPVNELINRLAFEVLEEAKIELLLSIRNYVTARNKKKDSVVCNPNFSKVISLLDEENERLSVKTQLALLICSVAKSSEQTVRTLIKHLVDDKIFKLILKSHDDRLIEACLRCLRSIMSWPKVARKSLIYDSQYIDQANFTKTSPNTVISKSNLHKIISYCRESESLVVHECISDIFAATCSRNKDQILLYRAWALPCITELLESSSDRVIVSALNWLIQMCLNNNLVSQEVTKAKCPSGTALLDRLASMMNKDLCCEMQFLSARCFVNIHRALGVDNLKDDPRLSKNVLPALICMVQKDKPPHIRVKAAESIAYLIESDTNLQNTASVCEHLIESLANMLDFDPLSKLDSNYDTKLTLQTSNSTFKNSNRINNLPPPPALQLSLDPRHSDMDYSSQILCTEIDLELCRDMKRSAFVAIAALASNLEPIRKKIFNTCSIMQHLVKNLNETDTRTLRAVLTCLLSLSRSVQQLRTSFPESSVYSSLKNLLSTSSNDVLILVLAILCNVSLEFSPGKQHFLDDSTIDTICKLTHKQDSFLRLHGMWILMNMVYQLRDEGIKFRILRTVGINHVLSLIEIADDDEIVLKTLGFLRNLLSQKSHIDSIMANHGDQIMRGLMNVLERSTSSKIKEQILCVMTNIADGAESKSHIMNNMTVLNYLARIMCDEQAGDSRLAAICCITNLALKESDGSCERREEMKKFGIEEKLKAMLITNDPVLFDRVRTAYNQFLIGIDDKYVN